MDDWFPVRFDFNFGERLVIYQLIGSWYIPDAESLAIPLLRHQIHGVAMRQSNREDWLWISYQNLHNVTPLPGYGMTFMLLPNAFLVIGMTR